MPSTPEHPPIEIVGDVRSVTIGDVPCRMFEFRCDTTCGNRVLALTDGNACVMTEPVPGWRDWTTAEIIAAFLRPGEFRPMT
jgi:hypothetical protein